MAQKKFYAVAVGRRTGVFTDWASAEREVRGFAGAKFKSFPTRVEAEAWLRNPVYGSSAAGGKRGGSKKRSDGGGDAQVAPGSIVIYTDGGALGNPGPGGYGVVIMDGDRTQELSGGYRMTTNNRMEMTACLVALRQISGEGRPVVLHSDSSYLVNGVSKGWARKWRAKGWRKGDGTPALNTDLWAELLDVLEGLDVEFRWVRGHAGNPLNERCDQLAVASARQTDLPIDHGYERTGQTRAEAAG